MEDLVFYHSENEPEYAKKALRENLDNMEKTISYCGSSDNMVVTQVEA